MSFACPRWPFTVVKAASCVKAEGALGVQKGYHLPSSKEVGGYLDRVGAIKAHSMPEAVWSLLAFS